MVQNIQLVAAVLLHVVRLVNVLDLRVEGTRDAEAHLEERERRFSAHDHVI